MIGESVARPRHVRRRHQPAAHPRRSGATTATGSPSARWRSTDPRTAIRLLRRMGDDVKVPILVQGSIHGDEYEGVDSNMEVIEKYATTPYGSDSAGRRDPQQRDPRLQRDPEPGRPRLRRAPERQRVRPQPRLHDPVAARDARTRSGGCSAGWRPRCSTCTATRPPTLIEATTKPHNPSIEYDMWLKWNQPRIDANEAALDAIGQDVQRPINDWCPESDSEQRPLVRQRRHARSRRRRGLGRLGAVLRPDVPPAHRPRLLHGRDVQPGESAGERLVAPVRRPRGRPRDIHTTVQESTFEFVVDNREEHARRRCSRSTAAVTRTRRGRSAARRRSTPSSTTGCSTTRRRT